MIRNEYLRFMQTLNAQSVPEHVIKLANIVLDHLDELIPLGTAHGRRLQKTTGLAQQEFQSASNECPVVIEEVEVSASKITRLKSLTVGPFRGFTKQEVFDLDSQIVLVYGPNGSGKSSFCEAVEYGLLGSVEEAASKRFAIADGYLKNAHVGRFTHPIIEASTSGAESVIINSSESEFRFCFVERNRIENFSRIAAHLPARQTELISTLFGLDAFNNFVRGFSETLDERYIDLVGKKGFELAKKRTFLEGDRQTIKSNTEELDELVAEEQELADLYQKDMHFGDFVLALGMSENPGEIQRIEIELEQPTATLSGLTHADLLQARTTLLSTISNLKAKQIELSGYSEGLSYKRLYQSVIELTSVNQEQCPACKTPLAETSKNPFQVAKDGLAQLEHLSELEQQRDDLKIGQQEALKAINEKLKQVCQLIENEGQSNPLQKHMVANDSQLDVVWWQALIYSDEQDKSAWLMLEQQVKQLEAADVATSQKVAARQQKDERLKELRKLHDKVIILQTRRKSLEDGITKANTSIAMFDEANKVLIGESEEEKKVIAQNKDISAAYSSFIRHLVRYKESLPRKLVADLGMQVVQLYNAFNRTDAQNDLLADLKLPVSSGDRIQISFNSEPGRYFDALHVLSEGHIRCVGLAILLAKNLKEGCPILIFDDPVNAIDGDHKESIRRTLFEDDHFSEKQIILTCHGEEFYKDIQNLLGAERTKAAKRFTFLPQLGDKDIQVDFQSNPRNYVLAAQEHIRRLEIRDALAASRRALETLARKVWAYISKYGDGNLSIKLRSAKSPIELRNLTEQLKKHLNSSGFTQKRKDSVLSPIITLLGVDGNSREWRYLNKGTHEESDKEEFDRVVVTEIVKALTDLDNSLS